MTDQDPDTGGVPEALVTCTECGRTYPAQRSGSGAFRPIGVEGGCGCGNDEFEPTEAD